jgi:dTDP-glucose 4,6-dehydratase
MTKNNNKKITCAISGGFGFVGAHFVEHFLKNTDWDIVVLDKLSYATNGYDRLRDINIFDEKRVKIFPVDLNLPLSDGVKKEIGEVDYIINLASESHVDNSIDHPVEFIQNNVNLVLNMLEWAKELKCLKKFVQFSTDEVYGTAPDGVNYKEGDRHNSGNPYSASKSAQESIVRAYANTYKLPVIITNTMNVIGERQHPEKFVPLVIRKVLNGETISIHSNKDKTRAGQRFYIHARNVANAVHFIIEETDELLDNVDASKGVFNVVGEKELDNLTLARMIAGKVGKELKYEMVDFHSSRPGHDLRYALDGKKLKDLGFEYQLSIEESLGKTIEWTLENKRWINEE